MIQKKYQIWRILWQWEKDRKLKRQEKEILYWENAGRPLPPPHLIKQRTLEFYMKKFNLKILVETGTYYGDMVVSMKDKFEHIYTIELSRMLYEKVKRRFIKYSHIKPVCGDSGVELEKIMAEINKPALFWLDAHYSYGDTARGEKDTPIEQELELIFNYPDLGHVIVIDDARCFGSEVSYPRIEDIKILIKARRPGVNITVENDMIRITP